MDSIGCDGSFFLAAPPSCQLLVNRVSDAAEPNLSKVSVAYAAYAAIYGVCEHPAGQNALETHPFCFFLFCSLSLTGGVRFCYLLDNRAARFRCAWQRCRQVWRSQPPSASFFPSPLYVAAAGRAGSGPARGDPPGT